MRIIELGNDLKRTLVQKLVKNSAGRNYSCQKGIKKVLISRPNHRLGNLLLITPLIQEVTNLFPGCRIDLFVSGQHSAHLFQEYENIDRIISLPRKPGKDLLTYARRWLQLRQEKYDLVINAVEASSSGRLSTGFADSGIRFAADTNRQAVMNQYSDVKHMAKYPLYALREFLGSLGMEIPEQPTPLLDIKLTTSELEKGRRVLREIIPENKKTICVFTNATGYKCLAENWWMDFYDLLKSELPDYQILEVLPVENISRIQFQAPSYYTQDIREMGAVIANTSVCISGDCGVMHLASASRTPTLGLFNRNRFDVYGPYGNNSTSVNINLQSAGEIIEVLKRQVLNTSSEKDLDLVKRVGNR